MSERASEGKKERKKEKEWKGRGRYPRAAESE
jgi:hypothetical protein